VLNSTGVGAAVLKQYAYGYDLAGIDPSADQSRALAILCGYQIGETNKATELMKNFKQPDARWAQWASAWIELQTGSVSNATVRFVELTKKQPTVTIFLPNESLNGWGKIDWQIFHKLMASGNP
jgi:hypothetical protein